MAVGLGVLGRSPSEFWAMTISEYAAAIRGLVGDDTALAPLPRDTFHSLMQRFPDVARQHGGDSNSADEVVR